MRRACHGPAFGVGFVDFSSEKRRLRARKLGHDGALSRAGLDGDEPRNTGETRHFLGQPSRADLAKRSEDRAAWRA
jgi:hypothetical protein